MIDEETVRQFEQRKKEHISLSLDANNEAIGGSGLDCIRLEHQPFPELDFNEVDISTKIFGRNLKSPIFVSSMTAGHAQGASINKVLSRACAKRGWALAVGSQRRQLMDKSEGEWLDIRKEHPDLVLLGNLGLSQIINTPTKDIERIVQSLGATALFVHTNPLQECLQPEGTPQFRGGLRALSQLAKNLSIPVLVKETGCGFSQDALKSLVDSGVAVVDVSGYGGTHWGRIEGDRAQNGSNQDVAAKSFAYWGTSTVQSMINAQAVERDFDIWASGGVRSGLDVARLLAMGAQMVGLAKPMLESALEGTSALVQTMDRFEFELKTAMFCMGIKDVSSFSKKKVWQWQTTK